jgi:hypothetical protein
MAEHVQPERRAATRQAAALEPPTEPLDRPHVPTLGERQAAFRDSVAAARPNRTGLPDRLKTGIESLSGFSMDDVKVHYGSAKAGTLQAHAYAQGTDIHVAPGAEIHLPHEAWHVVQQKQGRVKATMQMRGTPVNEDAGLESEATRMGAAALTRGLAPSPPRHADIGIASVAQRAALSTDSVVTLGVDFKANHLAANEGDARTISLSRAQGAGKKTFRNTVLKTSEADLIAAVEGSEFNDWADAGNQWGNAFDLDHWYYSIAQGGKNNYTVGTHKEGVGSVSLGAYFNRNAADTGWGVKVTKILR